jgi:hypothetical protein
MRLVPATAFAIALGSAYAMAQPAPQSKPAFALPPESVTVTAAKPSDDVIKSYIEKRMAPTRVIGRLARWTKPACPQTIGLGPRYAKFVTQRIRDIAAAVGAPLNEDPTCRPNVEVIFTTTPQGLLDNVRQKQPILLGYHNTVAQGERLAKVTHPIQAWYTTESLDLDGNRSIDNGRCGFDTSISVEIPNPSSPDMPGGSSFTQMSLPCAVIVHSSGFRSHDGLSSGLFNIIIAAEPAKLLDREIGSLADYIAMLALSQPSSLDHCEELLSISNLLVPGCTAAASHITDGDLAYLRGLYKMPEGFGLATQINQLRYQMKKVLVTDKGG